MAKRVTTLFIRDTGINLLVMKNGRVDKWATLPLDAGLVSQGLILDEAEVAAKVRQIFREAKAKTNKVIIALGGHDSLYRVMSLPELPEAVIPEAVKREVKRTIPTPLEEIYFSYQRLPSSKGECRIFLAAFPRNRVDVIVRTLREAGIKPYVMDLAPLALCRVPNEPRAIIINARLDHLDVMVLADRLPQVIRRLSLPTEAESLDDKLPFIAEEFNRTVAFYNSGHMENPLDTNVPVFVCGDPVEAPDTWQSLVGGAGYQVSALPSPMEAPDDFNPDPFMVNIGLALRELLVEEEGANFSLVNFSALPEAYVPPGFSMLRVLIPVVTIVGIGAVIFAVVLVLLNRSAIGALGPEVTAAETQVTQLQQNILTLRTQANSVNAIADGLDSRFVSMEQGRAGTYLDLREIVDLAAGPVSFLEIAHGGGLIAVRGTAPNLGLIYSYARDLRNSPRFSRVWVGSVTGTSGKGFNFEFSVTK